MKTFFFGLGFFLGLILAYVVWRIIATHQAGLNLNRKIQQKIQPVLQQINSGNKDIHEKVQALAQDPSTRRSLFEALKETDHEDLFPPQFMNNKAAAEADIVFWLLHPNELGDVPDEIELMKMIQREYKNKRLEYYVFRFKMNEPHWAAKDGWLVAISGPYWDDLPLYTWASGTFSSFESYDSKTPEQHVEWLHEVMEKKGMYTHIE